jgi:hypothetical protein
LLQRWHRPPRTVDWVLRSGETEGRRNSARQDLQRLRSILAELIMRNGVGRFADFRWRTERRDQAVRLMRRCEPLASCEDCRALRPQTAQSDFGRHRIEPGAVCGPRPLSLVVLCLTRSVHQTQDGGHRGLRGALLRRARERFVGIKREIMTSAYYNDSALLLHALGCLNLNKHSLAGSRVTSW